jgi:hypothetical protein
MIDDPLPQDWRELQAGVCRLFREIGLTAEVEVPLKTPRGKVTVDLFAVDNESVDKIQYIVECKNWDATIPQAVVHAFTTVMHETGANLGFIVSKHGLQPGATMYTENTNIQGLTYQQLQQRYFNVWWQRYFCIQVAAAADAVNEYVEPINSRRDRFLKSLQSNDVDRFHELQRRYAGFGKLMWLEHIRTTFPQYARNSPPDIEQYKNYMTELLGEEFAFDAKYFRSLLAQIRSKAQEIEEIFNTLFGRNIFDREA